MSESVVLPFWECRCPGDAPAVFVDGELQWRHGELVARVLDWQAVFASRPRGVVLCRIGNRPEPLPALLAALAEGHVAMLVDDTLPPASLEALIRAYRPAAVLESVDGECALRDGPGARDAVSLNPELCLLLSTSGSTGSPKFVQLSRGAVRHNASAIAAALDVQASDVAVAHLALHYSYGWSVVASHLTRGAALSFSSASFTERAFWQSIRDAGATHLPGVPAHYEILHRLRLQRLDIPSVSVMTQAGGRLAAAVRDDLHAHLDAQGKRFFVMYGQTEAGPRMSVLDHDDYRTHADSVGRALPGGTFEILQDDGSPAPVGEAGQVVYRGPNVMLGYAGGWRDLVAPADPADQIDRHAGADPGRLVTGDLGRLDAQGFLVVDGRLARTGKAFGLRISLDEVEAHLESLGPYVVCACDRHVGIVRSRVRPDDAGIDETERRRLLDHLSTRFVIPPAAWRFELVETIPHTERGKVDYRALERRHDEPR